MLIRMRSTAPGSVDGIRVALYSEGQEYDLGGTAGARDLAAAFVATGFAEPIDAALAPAVQHEPETVEPVAETTELMPAPGRRAPRAKK